LIAFGTSTILSPHVPTSSSLHLPPHLYLNREVYSKLQFASTTTPPPPQALTFRSCGRFVGPHSPCNACTRIPSTAHWIVPRKA
jgi:hypothetical protein